MTFQSFDPNEIKDDLYNQDAYPMSRLQLEKYPHILNPAKVNHNAPYIHIYIQF